MRFFWSAPSASAHRGTRAAVTLVPDAVVGILTRGNFDARFARLIDQRNDVRALTPDVDTESFDVRDHDRQMRFLADANRLAHRGKQADGVRALVAHMRVVDAAVLRGDFESSITSSVLEKLPGA